MADPFYQTGGTLPPGALSYVERSADRELLDALRHGEFSYVLDTRQTGKSSLIIRTAHKLRLDGHRAVVIDLTSLGRDVTADQWCSGVLLAIGEQLDLADALLDVWERNAKLGPIDRFLRVLRYGALPELASDDPNHPASLILFFDEIDFIRSLPFNTDAFFAAIRAAFNARADDPEFRRLVFCLVGVAAPADLIRDSHVTPFNIGRDIRLEDFTLEEAAPLAAGLKSCIAGRQQSAKVAQAGSAEDRIVVRTGPKSDDGSSGDTSVNSKSKADPDPQATLDSRRLLKRVLYWTGGHPYLTHRLCRALAESIQCSASTIRNADVDSVCRNLFFTEAAREQERNLATVQKRLLESSANVAQLLTLYGRVLSRGHLHNDLKDPAYSALRLTGVVREESDRLVPRNRIYRRVFDRKWLLENMPDAELRRQRAAHRQGIFQAGGVATVLLLLVGWMALFADTQWRIASRARVQTDQILYDADMSLLQNVWEKNPPDSERTRELLKETASLTDSLGGALPGFEWGYWNRQNHSFFGTLRGHTGSVSSVAISPDGERIVTGSFDNTARVWDAITGGQTLTLKGHRGPLSCVAFSRDGQFILSASFDKTVRVWNSHTGRSVLTIKGHTNTVSSAAFSNDGDRIVTGSYDRHVKVWNARTGAEILAIKDDHDAAYCVAFSPDGSRIASGGSDSITDIWDAHTGKLIRKLKGHTNAVYSVVFSSDGRHVVTGSSDQSAKVWDVRSGAALVTLQGHTGAVLATDFCSGGSRVVTGSGDNTARIWDAATGKLLLILQGSNAPVTSLACSPDGRRIVTGSEDSTAKVWDSQATRDTLALKGHSSAISSVAFSPDGARIVTASQDATAKVWDAATGHPNLTLKGHLEAVSSAVFSSDGNFIVTGSEDSSAIVWDAWKGTQMGNLSGMKEPILSVAFSPDGGRVAAGSKDGAVKIWDWRARTVLLALKGHKDAISSVAFSLDGSRIATGSRDTTARIWDAHTGDLLHTLTGHSGAINSVAFSADGSKIVTGSSDGTAKVFDVKTGNQTHAFRGHADAVSAVAFSPDGNRILTGSSDHTAKLWDTHTDRETLTLIGHSGAVSSVAFSSNHRRILTGGMDNTARVWDADFN